MVLKLPTMHCWCMVCRTFTTAAPNAQMVARGRLHRALLLLPCTVCCLPLEPGRLRPPGPGSVAPPAPPHHVPLLHSLHFLQVLLQRVLPRDGAVGADADGEWVWSRGRGMPPQPSATPSPLSRLGARAL